MVVALSFWIIKVLFATTAEPLVYWKIPVVIGLVVPAVLHFFAMRRATEGQYKRKFENRTILYVSFSVTCALILVFWLNKVWPVLAALHIHDEGFLFFILGMTIVGNGVGCLYHRIR